MIPSRGVSATDENGSDGGGAAFRAGFGLTLIFGALSSIGRHGANAAVLTSADWVASPFDSSGLDVSCGGDSGCGCSDAVGAALSAAAGCCRPSRCGAPRMVWHPDNAANARTAQILDRCITPAPRRPGFGGRTFGCRPLWSAAIGAA